ncbi:MAG: translation initiation factor IF-6 [Candidatus Woesearchaeota archaeon]|nr:translation initiation factor IF-6 [Candidatus Woesearchaeota archaeon]
MVNIRISKLSMYGNPNIGLYCYATDRYCLVGRVVSDKFASEIGKILGVPVHRINIAGISLIGDLIAGNDRCLLVPKIVFDDELSELDRLGIKYRVVGGDLTALGNNMLANNNGAVISSEYSDEETLEIEEALGVKVLRAKIGQMTIVGSSAIMNATSGVINPNISPAEKSLFEDTLKVKFYRSTVNFGNPFVKSGMILNSKGLILGDPTTTIELMQIQEAFE